MKKHELEELNKTIIEFCGWCNGYIHGSKLDYEEPHIFIKVKEQLFNYQEKLTKEEI